MYGFDIGGTDGNGGRYKSKEISPSEAQLNRSLHTLKASWQILYCPMEHLMVCHESGYSNEMQNNSNIEHLRLNNTLVAKWLWFLVTGMHDVDEYVQAQLILAVCIKQTPRVQQCGACTDWCMCVW
jgi:hypothetical protein